MSKILKYGNQLLRQKAIEIPIGQNVSKLIKELNEAMTEYKGIGIAAPQIGISKRIFLIAGFGAIINPVLSIDGSKGLCAMDEGCLSIPTIVESIDRPVKIKIIYYNSSWEKIEEEHEGIIARIMQHEYDHLEGVLFIDHLSLIRRRLLSNKLKAISKMK